MAGDWIKMRAGLLTHPKVIGMVRYLESDWAFFNFVCQDGITGGEIGGYDPEPRIVTDFVTRQALRCVTVSGLLALWSSARLHSDSGFLHGLAIADLDEMAGIPSFGKAMESVGWAVFDKDNQVVVLPNFLEWNDQTHKGPTMSNAERQKAFRMRQKYRNETVTKSNVEKSREEKSREEVKPKTKAPPELVLPFESDQFREAWSDFVAMRSEIKKPLKPTAIKLSLTKLEAMGEAVAIQSLKESTANQWQGLFEPKGNQNGNGISRSGVGSPNLLERAQQREAQQLAVISNWAAKRSLSRSGVCEGDGALVGDEANRTTHGSGNGRMA